MGLKLRFKRHTGLGGREELHILNVIDDAQSNPQRDPQMFGLWTSVVFPALHPVPLLRNDNWPNRHFLGEAGTKAPASTLSESEQYT